MKNEELKGMSDEQLALTLKTTEKQLFMLRFQSATDRLETPSEIRKAKREIARIKTIQRQRELAKLEQLPDADILAQVGTLVEKIDGPGKRRVQRGLARLYAIQEARTMNGSGK